MTQESKIPPPPRFGLYAAQWAIICLGLLSIIGFLLLDRQKDLIEASRDATADRSRSLALQVEEECEEGGAAARQLGDACKEAKVIATDPVVEPSPPQRTVLIPGETITARATLRTTVTPAPVTTTATAPGSTTTSTATSTATEPGDANTTTSTTTRTATTTSPSTTTSTATRTETRTATATATATETRTCILLGLLGCKERIP